MLKIQKMLSVRYKPGTTIFLFVVVLGTLFWCHYMMSSPSRISTKIQNHAYAASLAREATSHPTPKFSEIIVHFDLKGAPPLMPYYTQLFPLLKKWGATGILMEYEDTFPYSGVLEALRSDDAYSKQDISDILALAKDNDLSVIPLIQAFGHLEFALKLPEFEELREVPSFPNMLCPSKPASLKFVKDMIGQVMMLHPESKYIHIGLDEVYQLGKCPLCQKRGLSNKHIFLEHMLAVAGHVSSTFNVVPLVWDDMFRHFPLDTMLDSNIKESRIQPVVWNYHAAHNFDRIDISWGNYRRAFDHVWAASAFKGATRADAMVTNITHHLQNHINWLNVLAEQKPLFEKEGKSFDRIVMTGWQRYNHFASFCELLPVSLPSLAVSMKVIQNNGWKGYMKAQLEKELGFLAGTLDLLADPIKCSPHSSNPRSPKFPGGEVFGSVHNWCAVKNNIEELLSGPTRNTWLSAYNVQQKRSSPIILQTHFLNKLHDTKISILPNTMAQHVQRSLSHVFNKKTVEEWMECFVNPVLQRLDSTKKEAKELMQVFAPSE